MIDEYVIPLDAEPSEEYKKQAIAMKKAGLGEAEIKIAASYTMPFFWTLRNPDGTEKLKGASAFLLDTGERVFGVTAAHVTNECFNDSKNSNFTQCMLAVGGGRASLPFHLGDRIIDGNEAVDIATFWLRPEEIQYTGKTALRGYNKTWPPPLPQVEGLLIVDSLATAVG